jgi:hypothetical protein
MGERLSLNEIQIKILGSLIIHETILDGCKLKGVTSYQLSKSTPPISAGSWANHCKFLEDNMLIRKQSNKKSIRGAKPYSITPLGITRFGSIEDVFNIQLLDKMLSILKCKYIEGKPENENSDIELFKDYCNEIENVYFTPSDIYVFFTQVLSNIELKDEVKLGIFLNFETYYGSRIRLTNFVIEKNKIKLLFDATSWDSISREIDEKDLDYMISKFIIGALSFQIIHYLMEVKNDLYIHRTDNKYSFLGQDEADQKKSNKATRLLLSKQLKKIPWQIYNIANDFHNGLYPVINRHSDYVAKTNEIIQDRLKDHEKETRKERKSKIK